MLKSSKVQTLRVNNSKILRIQNAKFSGYCFYMNTKKWRDFQICTFKACGKDTRVGSNVLTYHEKS